VTYSCGKSQKMILTDATTISFQFHDTDASTYNLDSDISWIAVYNP